LKLRLGTRGSALALAQAELVANGLSADVEIVPIQTSGDERRGRARAHEFDPRVRQQRPSGTNDEPAGVLEPQRPGRPEKALERGSVATRERALKRRRPRESHCGSIGLASLVVERGDSCAQPGFEPPVYALRDRTVGDRAEAPVRGRESEEGERKEAADQLDLEAPPHAAFSDPRAVPIGP
jgi:hypothetical protein